MSLACGRNGKAIWQDLVSEQGFTGSYQAVKRFIQKLRGPQRPEPAGLILTAPGEEAQVDYNMWGQSTPGAEVVELTCGSRNLQPTIEPTI